MKLRKQELFLNGVVVWVVFFTDRASKVLANRMGLVQFNQGGVLGLLPGWLWLGLGVVILVAMAWWWFGSEKWWQRVGISILLAAGAANVLDRILYGGVVDFIYYRGVGLVGNMADIWLGLGVVWLVYWNWFGVKKV